MEMADSRHRNVSRRARMHHDGHENFPQSRELAVFAEGLQRFTRQIAMVEQRQGQVFGQARVGGHGSKDLWRRIMHQPFQIGVGGEANFSWRVAAYPWRLRLLRRFLPAFFFVGRRFAHRLTPRCAAISSAPSTGRTKAKLTAACGCSAFMASRNAWRTSDDPWSTPPASATGTTPPLGHKRLITALASPASAWPARSMMARAVSSPCSAAFTTGPASSGNLGSEALAMRITSSGATFHDSAMVASNPLAFPKSNACSAAVTASLPTQKADPSSETFGPQPPARAVSPFWLRPKAIDPVPEITSTPGDVPNAARCAITWSPAT